MYPRNAASPERIAVGAVIQISDGAPQSSGVTITVRGQGGAEASGGGTIAYGATGVIVYYTPTQAETNFTSFTVIASKSGCIPVAQTIVTTATSTPGRTMPADGSVTAAVIATGAIDADAIADNAIDAGAIASNAITAAKIATDAITAAKIAAGAIDAATFAADVDAEVRGWLGLASANLDTQLGDISTVAEFEARTLVAADYATATAQTTAQNDLDLITGADGVTLATLQGNYAPAKAGDEMDLVNAPNATAIAAIQNGVALATSLPANFSDLLITADGYVSRVVLVDTTTTNSDMRGTDSAATAAALASLVTTVGVAGAGLTEAGGTGDQLTALATAAELAKVPKQGQTFKHRNVTTDVEADVIIEAAS